MTCAHSMKAAFLLNDADQTENNQRTIVATRCFRCCSLRLQQYRQTHSVTPSRFTLPLKQPTDTSALSARFDRRFALSNGVFHVKHRFFYCFPVGILFFFLLCILLVFSLLRFVLSDCRVCLIKHFVCFYHFCGFARVLLPILSANTPLLFFCVRHLMWAGRDINVVLRRLWHSFLRFLFCSRC